MCSSSAARARSPSTTSSSSATRCSCSDSCDSSSPTRAIVSALIVGQVDAGLVGRQGPLPRHELSLALRQQVLGLLQELLRLLADPDLDLLLGGRRLAVVDDAAQAARRASGLGQLLQPGMDIALAHVPSSIGRGGRAS